MGEKGDRTREKIVACALQLFSRKGYYGTSVQDVTQAVGLTKGALYAHFRNKEALWDAAYEEAVRIWRGIVFRGADGIEDPLRRMAAVIEQDLLGYVGQGVFAGGCFFLNCLMEVSGRHEVLTRRILDGYAGFAHLHERWLLEAREKGLLRDGVDAHGVAESILVMLNGATALYAAGRDRAVLSRSVERTRDMLESLRKTERNDA